MRTNRINLNQMALPFGQKQTRTLSYEDRERFFWGLVGISIMALALYVYAIIATARNVAERQALERSVAESASELGSLEFAVIELKNAVTIEKAHAYGFSEVKEPLYVSRGTNTLTLNTVTR